MIIRQLLNSLAVVCLIGFLGACSTAGICGSTEISGYGYGGETDAKAASDAHEAEAGKTITVTIENYTFEPSLVTISPADTLVFVNEDGAPHTTTAKTGAFDTGNLAAGETDTISIADVGTYEYLCAVHPTMTGSIVVE